MMLLPMRLLASLLLAADARAFIAPLGGPQCRLSVRAHVAEVPRTDWMMMDDDDDIMEASVVSSSEDDSLLADAGVAIVETGSLLGALGGAFIEVAGAAVSAASEALEGPENFDTLSPREV